jgi:ferric-dicitrate binding protein FerR (iron transport regulator)
MSNDDLLREWGERERAAAPTTRVPVERFRAPRRRARWALAAAAVIAVLAVAINLLAARLTGSHTDTPGSTGPYDRLVLHEGATVLIEPVA